MPKRLAERIAAAPRPRFCSPHQVISAFFTHTRSRSPAKHTPEGPSGITGKGDGAAQGNAAAGHDLASLDRAGINPPGCACCRHEAVARVGDAQRLSVQGACTSCTLRRPAQRIIIQPASLPRVCDIPASPIPALFFRPPCGCSRHPTATPASAETPVHTRWKGRPAERLRQSTAPPSLKEKLRFLSGLSLSALDDPRWALCGPPSVDFDDFVIFPNNFKLKCFSRWQKWT